AVGVHDVDLGIAVAATHERNAALRGRRRGRRRGRGRRWWRRCPGADPGDPGGGNAVGDLCDPASVGVHDVYPGRDTAPIALERDLGPIKRPRGEVVEMEG